jgi:uncharacterized protein
VRLPIAVVLAAVMTVSLAVAAPLGPATTVPSRSAASAPASAVQSRVPPAPDRWVTDGAGFLSRQAAAALDARLEDFERRTGHQVIVWIGRTIGEGASLEDWAVRAFEAWKVGRRGLDDGLVLFILAEDRRVRIEVGYGLEDKVPDILAFRVIDEVLAPGIRAGRPDEAVSAAVTALLGYISGEAAPTEGAGPAERPGGTLAGKIVTVLIVLVLLFLFITNPSLALWLLFSILSGGRGGGGRGGGWGGGGGGGFSGGGGRSGGGGASGGW